MCGVTCGLWIFTEEVGFDFKLLAIAVNENFFVDLEVFFENWPVIRQNTGL